MKSNPSASRIAMISAVLMVICAALWFSWPTFFPNNSKKVVATSQANVLNSNDEAPAEEEVKTPTHKEEYKTSTSKPKDFRLTEDDSFATVQSDHFYTTTSVTDLTPAERENTFQIGQRVYAYAGIRAPKKETVRITWYDSENNAILPSAYLDVEPNTGPVGFRVFTYRIFRAPGDYKVVISNSAGIQLAASEFIIVEK